ncbi:MAG: hypothetical protein KDA49_01115 [Rhodospirillaceae bacterium]|nr:hypothetical protein [Rhodospirillaceae bacterium]
MLCLFAGISTGSVAQQSQAEQHRLQQRYARLIVGKWGQTLEGCRRLPDIIYHSNGTLTINDTEGWWRLTGSTLYSVGFDHDLATPQTGKSGVVSAWAITWHILQLDRHTMVWRSPDKKTVRSLVRC